MTASLFGSWPAHADPIHRDRETRAERIAALGGAGAYRTWSEYLTGGPSVWSTIAHPQVTPAVESAIWKAIRTDPGDTSPWLKFMLWKQSVDPTRFARFHPKVAVALDKLSAAPTTVSQAWISPPSTPNNDTPSSPTQAQSITQIPEPGPWLLALSMAGWGLWRFRSRRTY
jgi:hypothetical protein